MFSSFVRRARGERHRLSAPSLAMRPFELTGASSVPVTERSRARWGELLPQKKRAPCCDATSLFARLFRARLVRPTWGPYYYAKLPSGLLCFVVEAPIDFFAVALSLQSTAILVSGQTEQPARQKLRPPMPRQAPRALSQKATHSSGVGRKSRPPSQKGRNSRLPR